MWWQIFFNIVKRTRIRNCGFKNVVLMLFLGPHDNNEGFISFSFHSTILIWERVSETLIFYNCKASNEGTFYSPIFSIHQMVVSLILAALFQNFSTRKGEKTFRQKSNCFTCQKSRKWKQNFLFPSAKVLSGKLYPRCNQYDDDYYSFFRSVENHLH